MAKSKSAVAGENKTEAVVFATAEAVGRALGMVAGTVDQLKAAHPHPIDEARAAIAEGQQQLSDLAADVSERADAIETSTKAAVKKTRKQATTRRRGAKIVSRARKTTRRVVKRAKKAVKRTRKQARKIVKRARKTVARARARARR